MNLQPWKQIKCLNKVIFVIFIILCKTIFIIIVSISVFFSMNSYKSSNSCLETNYLRIKILIEDLQQTALDYFEKPTIVNSTSHKSF